ncbi:MAG: hypothetical protein ACLTYW_04665 [Collinsella sp.]
MHDRDRAGHLIAKVVEAVDYRIPLSLTIPRQSKKRQLPRNMLREAAAALDPTNWDAQRMLTALTADSNEEYVQYLVSKRDEVEHDLALKIASAQDPYEREAAGDLMRRPYLRWLAALASRALISGRYRMSLEAANRSLDFAPNDPAVSATPRCSPWQSSNTPPRSSSAFALPLRPYLANTPLRRRPKDAERDLDPWTLIALMSAAWRELDYESAEHYLRILARSCPHAAEALYFQTEFPDGVYARVNVGVGSTDELVLALSEATPVLQEGLGAPTAPVLPPGSPPTISCAPKSMSAYCGRPSRVCRLRERPLMDRGVYIPPTWSAPTLRRTPNSPMQHAILSITT